MPIDAPTWRAMSATHKDDVWEYVQRKYDIPAYLKEWVMKDLDQKWRSWKYELRNKYFNPTLKQNEQQIQPDPRVNVEQWKRVVQTWSSNSWKTSANISQTFAEIAPIGDADIQCCYYYHPQMARTNSSKDVLDHCIGSVLAYPSQTPDGRPPLD
ncbi:hypothetical protein Taro_007455 [Colocasia esculenta]|uniref:Uncharacterized protein n=1 Tax=Colocasia esculenta TaxID=4460 RepID=A0A843U0D0_COLES|nr:hypothetical protein [Colocasia esculenta]